MTAAVASQAQAKQQKPVDVQKPMKAQQLSECESEREDSSRPPWVLIAAIVIFNVVGKIGDAVGPAMVGTMPFSLLLLNSSNTHCILTTTSVAFWPWILVTVLRRICEDPIYFYLGWKYRVAALDMLRQWSPEAADGFGTAEEMFRNNLYVAVAVNPGATVCGLAGASRMPPLTFFALNIGSTTAQLLLMRAVCSKFPDQLDYARELINQYMQVLVIIMVVITLWGAVPTVWSKFQEWRQKKQHTE